MERDYDSDYSNSTKESNSSVGSIYPDSNSSPQDKNERTEIPRYSGIADLPNQIYRKSAQKTFHFTLMVVGRSGLGKSTLINSLFLSEIYGKDYPGPSERKTTLKIDSTKILLKEKYVKILLTLVDTPGFDDIDYDRECWVDIVDYIESKFDDYLVNEMKIDKETFSDPRVHCCLYFISPSGLGKLDIDFLKQISGKVNIVPLIAKGDTLTQQEKMDIKRKVLKEIIANDIIIYEFPGAEESLKEKIPFAVVGSEHCIDIGGEMIRCRQYPWGMVNIENPEHSDLPILRKLIVRTHLVHLKDSTESFYEDYRIRLLTEIAESYGHPDTNPLLQFDKEKQEHKVLIKKLYKKMEKAFNAKINMKKEQLLDLAQDVQKKKDETKEIQEELIQINEKRRLLEEERKQWEIDNNYKTELANDNLTDFSDYLE